jgi:hypothetical protein
VGVSISYVLTGRGWSECTITINEHRATITASYLSDALGDLIGATIRIMEGQTDATASFAEEPGEYRWRMTRRDADRISVQIFEFEQLWSNQSDDEAKTVLQAECRLRTFAGALLSAANDVLTKHGLQGYRSDWVTHEFPTARLQRLRELLRKRLD